MDIVHDVTDDLKHYHNDCTELVCIGEEVSEQLISFPSGFRCFVISGASMLARPAKTVF